MSNETPRSVKRDLLVSKEAPSSVKRGLVVSKETPSSVKGDQVFVLWALPAMRCVSHGLFVGACEKRPKNVKKRPNIVSKES